MSDEFEKQLERTSKLQAKLCPVNGLDSFLPDKSLINGSKSVEQNGTYTNGDSNGKNTKHDDDYPAQSLDSPKSDTSEQDTEHSNGASDVTDEKENVAGEGKEESDNRNRIDDDNSSNSSESQSNHHRQKENVTGEEEEEESDNKKHNDGDSGDSSKSSESQRKHGRQKANIAEEEKEGSDNKKPNDDDSDNSSNSSESQRKHHRQKANIAEEEKEGSDTKKPNDDDSDDSSNSSESQRKHRRHYPQRITRKATGSLPKEPVKTLLSETTVKAGEEKKVTKTRTNKPGHYIVIAPDCTACGSDVILRPYKRNMLIHPILKSVICRQCHEFYHSDVFEKDEEGSEIYCVWCGEGGELIYCEKCEKAYCSDCIKRNFGRKKRDQIMNDDNWRCFLCVPGSLKKQHEISELVVKYQNHLIKDPKLTELFECEVKKSEMEEFNSHDYQMIVSDKIKERHTAQLMSLSQQKEESQADFPPDHVFSEEEEEERERSEKDAKSEKSEQSNSDDSDFESALKGKKRKEKLTSDSDDSKPKPKKEKQSQSTDDESDDAAFIELLRKKSKKRDPKEKDPSKKKASSDPKKEPKVKSETSSKNGTDSKTVSDNSDEEGSDDSLFTTGNPSVSTRRLRKKLDSDSGAEEFNLGESEDDDELMKKYKSKLSEYKDVGSDKESDFKPDSSDSSPEEEEPESEVKSSNSDKSSSDEEEKKKENSTAEEAEEKPKKKKRKKKRSADTDSEEDDEAPKKKKRKKKKKKKGSDESDSSSDDEPAEKKKRAKGKRHDIRKVMSKNKLKKETVAAQEAEEKRRLKLKEKAMPSEAPKLQNFILEDLRKEKNRSKPITFEDQDECRVIEVHKALKKKLKPHQLDGIQFMYDCCIESVAKVKSGEPGSGCILAHCMGLGKTLQVITFLTTMLEYHHIYGLRRMLVVCPLNTVRNWEAEFKKWLTHCDDPPEISVLSDNISNNEKRAEILENWYDTSGVLIIGYTLYRILSQGNNIRKKRLKDVFRKCLVEPGPDICVCDEGHIIKNEKTGISKALNSMISKRRVILTGTPLQNNLVEYHCMVSFVKPSLLGTVKEFKNMYENPINNGSCADATPYDIRLMKERSHILFEQLSGCVQRRDYYVLKEFLPMKYEYVLSIKLSDLQVKLYQKFLERVSGNGRLMSKIFESYQTLKKVWTHPWLLEADMKKKDYDSLEEFITDGSESEESWEASSEDSDFASGKKKKKNGKEKKKKSHCCKQKRKKRRVKKKEEAPAADDDDITCLTADQQQEVNDIADTIIPPTHQGGALDPHWFRGDVDEKDEKMLEHSGKLLVTLEILDKASQAGEKVLLFSQSLLALDFLETTIQRVGWARGRDYFRMDGSTKTDHRASFQRQFNDKNNRRCRLFLISTKAGGLGINLVAANRIILFDMSWNPADDTQSLFRSYRFGQQKTVYVYRLVARGTMEEKIYDRQVYKQSLSSRVIDEKQISRYFSANDLQELFSFDPSQQTCTTSVLAKSAPPVDEVLAGLLVEMDPPVVLEYHEHDSLLEHREDQQLTEEERKAAWANFKADKERKDVVGRNIGNQSVFQRLQQYQQYQQQQAQIITKIYSNQQELIIGGFSNEQIISIQGQLAPVVASGRLHVRHLGGGQLHISGLAPDQQDVFLRSIQQQQQQQPQPIPVPQPVPVQQQPQNQMSQDNLAVMQQRLHALMKTQQEEQHRNQLLMLEQMQRQQQAAQAASSSATPVTPSETVNIPD